MALESSSANRWPNFSPARGGHPAGQEIAEGQAERHLPQNDFARPCEIKVQTDPRTESPHQRTRKPSAMLIHSLLVRPQGIAIALRG
jgi:hypothetical protein